MGLGDQGHFDIAPLSWVIGEIRTALNNASTHLHDAVSQLVDERATTLLQAKSYLHQAHGALQIVEVDGVSIVTETVEELIERMQEGKLHPSNDAMNKISEAFDAVIAYLEDLLHGAQQQPVKLFPEYGALLQLKGAERIHPADLFFPALSMQEKIPELAIATPVPEVNYGGLRLQFEKMLLTLLTSKDKQVISQCLSQMTALINQIENAQTVPQTKAFWLVMRAFAESCEENFSKDEKHVKQIWGRINLQIRRLVDGNNSIPERLLRDALFFIAQTKEPTPFAEQIKKAYQLYKYEIVDYRQKHFGLVNPVAVAKVRELLSSAKNLWGRVSAGDQSSSEKFCTTLKDIADIGNDLNTPPLAKLLKELGGIGGHAVRSKNQERIGIELATCLLFVETSLDQLNRLPANYAERASEISMRLLSVVSGEVVEDNVSWIGEISREAQERETIAAVVTEMHSSLKQAENALDEYFRDTTQTANLDMVDGVLAQFGGALAILDQEDALKGVSASRRYVKSFKDGLEGKPETQIQKEFNVVAQNIGALSFFVDTLRTQPDLAKSRFFFNEDLEIFQHRIVETSVDKDVLQEEGQDTKKPLITAEDELLRQQQESDKIVASLAVNPNDSVLKESLKQSLNQEKSFAALLDDTEAGYRAKSALDILQHADFSQPQILLGQVINAPSGEVAVDAVVSNVQINDVCESLEIPQTQDEVDAELLEIFLLEADEVLGTVREHIPLSRSEPSNQDYLITLRRSFHTLKGSGRMVGLNEFGEGAWHIEQAMNLWLSESRLGSDDLYALLDYASNEMYAWVEELKTKGRSYRRSDQIIAAADRVRDGQAFSLEAIIPSENIHSSVNVPEASELIDESNARELSMTSIVDTPASLDVPEINFLSSIPSDIQTSIDDLGGNTENDLEDAVYFENIDSESVSPEDDLNFAIKEELDPSFDGTLDANTDSHSNLHPSQADVDSTDSIGLPEQVIESPTLFSLEQDLSEAVTPKIEPQLLEQTISLNEEAAQEGCLEQNNLPYLIEPETSLPVMIREDDGIKRIGSLEISHPLYTIYLSETDDLVRYLSQDISEWRLEPSRNVSRQAVHSAHSLSGSSGTVGLVAAQELAHSLELVLQRLEGHPVMLQESEFDLLEEALTSIKAMLSRFAVSELAERDVITQSKLDKLLHEVTHRNDHISSNNRLDIAPIVLETRVIPPDSGVNTLTTHTIPVQDRDSSSIQIKPAVNLDSLESPTTVTSEVNSFTPMTHPDSSVTDEIDHDLLPIFLEEGADLLPSIGSLLSEWRDKPSDNVIPQSILRLTHTVKGSARMAGAMRLGQITHELETSVENLMHTGESIRVPMIDELIANHDYGMQLFEKLQNPSVPEPDLPQKTLSVAEEIDLHQEDELLAVPLDGVLDNQYEESQTVQGLISSVAAEASVVNAPTLLRTQVKATTAPVMIAQTSSALIRVRAEILDRLVNQAGEVSISRTRLETELESLKTSLNELTDNVTRLKQQLREVEIQAESQIASQMATGDRDFDPLEFDRFTRLQELTRMMAESVSDVTTVQNAINRTIDDAETDLNTQARLTRELQQDLMRVRMVPFSSVSERLYRIARQTAKELDKRVNLDIRGTSVEVDRSILEKMVGPFEHMLRNAIFHGIESRQDRVTKGKDETGQLLIEIRQEGNEVVIQLRDDGQGLNVARIRNKAETMGLLTDESELSENEVMNLIFEPGFSTASEVTEIAGRGVGMDVVRTEAASLGGRVSVQSELGKGAIFTIHLPLTLAVTQVVLVVAGGKTIAIPSVLVEQIQQLKANALATAYNNGAVEWLGNRVPLYYFPSVLGDSDVAPDVQQYTPVIIVKSDNERTAIHVDQVIGNREVVVKNVGPQLARMIGIAGATVLGSGSIVLILNPVPLAQKYEHERTHLSAKPRDVLAQEMPISGAVAELQKQSVGTTPIQGLRTHHVVMVVDDSLTVRRVTQRLLTREGYQVVLAKDGIDALEQLQSITPDVMLVDIEMPRMDGFDLTRNVRGDVRTQHIPIVMITSRTADKHRNYAFELGVNEYFGKPYREDDLLATIKNYVEQTTISR